jgi:hypothetical protein
MRVSFRSTVARTLICFVTCAIAANANTNAGAHKTIITAVTPNPASPATQLDVYGTNFVVNSIGPLSVTLAGHATQFVVIADGAKQDLLTIEIPAPVLVFGPGTYQLKVSQSAAAGRTAIYEVAIPAASPSNSGGTVTSVGAVSPLVVANPTTTPTIALGIVPTLNGGTGLSSAGSAGNFLRSTGTGWTSAPIQPSDVPGLVGNFILNGTTRQANASFSIGGTGVVGGRLGVGVETPSARVDVLGASGDFGQNAPDVLRVRGGNGGFGSTAGPVLTAPGHGGNVVIGAGDGGDAFMVPGGAGGSIILQPGLGGIGDFAGRGADGAVVVVHGPSFINPVWGLIIENSAQTTYRAGIRLGNEGFFEVSNNILNPNPRFARLDSNGNWTAVSDRRLKSDIVSLDGLLAKALALRPVSYRFTGQESASTHFGLIAQEVESVLPEFVADAGGLKTLNYAGLSVVAIGAVQEQQSQIDRLKADNEMLLERLEQQQMAIENLRRLVCSDRVREGACR